MFKILAKIKAVWIKDAVCLRRPELNSAEANGLCVEVEKVMHKCVLTQF